MTAISSATRLLILEVSSVAVTAAAAAVLVVVLDLVLDLMLYRVHTVAHVASPSVGLRVRWGSLSRLYGA